MKKTLTTIAVCLLAANTLYGEVTEAEFQQLHKEIQASPKAVWRTIPWKTSLLNAQKQAAQERKLIFIWAMDGHPLGCT